MKNTFKKILFKLFDFILTCFFEYLEQLQTENETETKETKKTRGNNKKTTKKTQNQIVDEETGEVLNLDSDIVEGLKRVKDLKNKVK